VSTQKVTRVSERELCDVNVRVAETERNADAHFNRMQTSFKIHNGQDVSYRGNILRKSVEYTSGQ